MDAYRHRTASPQPLPRWATFSAPWWNWPPPRSTFDLKAKIATWSNAAAAAWVVLGSEGIFAAIDAKAAEHSGARLELSGLLLQGLLTLLAVPLVFVTVELASRRRADARWPLLLSGGALVAAEVAFWWVLKTLDVPINGPGPC